MTDHISDERLAAIEAHHAFMAEHGGNPMAQQYGAEHVAIIARLRAAEAVAVRLRKALAMPCMHCGKTPRVIIPMKGGGK